MGERIQITLRPETVSKLEDLTHSYGLTKSGVVALAIQELWNEKYQKEK